MRHFLSFLFLSVVIGQVVSAQQQLYNFQGYAIGQSASGAAVCNESYMSEIHKMGSTYYMYYSHKITGNEDAISYATSSDLINWTVVDTIFTGSTVTTDPEYIMGGGRIVQLSGGTYRMFYRCTDNFIPPAESNYHIRSAVSSDGITFVKEGIRIDIEAFVPGSYFTHVGHSEFFWDANGNLGALLTGKDTTMSGMQPDRIYSSVSFDEGLTWGNFTPLYNNCHDPVVIIDSTGMYHAYFTYLDQGFRTVESVNAAAWPATPDTVVFKQGVTTLTESTYPKIADLGAAVADDGTIYIYSNYETVAGPWTNVAYYKDATASLNESTSIQFQIYPNPANQNITIQSDQAGDATIFIYNTLGEIVHSQLLSSSTSIDVSKWQNGIYFYSISSNSVSIENGKFAKN